jgi:ABC-type transport system involved in cytochrome c biogenesis permease subunit
MVSVSFSQSCPAKIIKLLISSVAVFIVRSCFLTLKSQVASPTLPSASKTTRADNAGAIVLLAGVVNVPIIYFSVQWWSTLHQGATIRLDAAPSMAHTMLLGMLLMALACWAYTLAVCLVRTRCLIRERAAQEQL